ncbi:MAG: type II secretion system F family protein [Eubacterium sp.]|nr:type II secretion system F family protein [Eubacterium sp.]
MIAKHGRKPRKRGFRNGTGPGYVLSTKEKVLLAAGLTGGTLFISLVFYKSPLPALAVPAVYPLALKRASYALEARRKTRIRNAFRDLMNYLAASFASGRHLEEALEDAMSEMLIIYDSREPLITEIAAVISKLKKGGGRETEILGEFAARTDVEEIYDFVEIYGVLRETGGNIVSALEKSAAMIGEKITVENDIKGIIMQKQYEGRLITVMPVVIILFLGLISPGYLDVMYTTLAGRIVMTAALAAVYVAYRMIDKITAIEI